MYRLQKRMEVTKESVRRYVLTPEKMEKIGLDLLWRFLCLGLGLSDQEILDMKVGELFEIKEE